MTAEPTIECAVDDGTILGECPLWSVAEQALYWIDIDGKLVHRFDPATGVDESRTVSGRPGSLGLTDTPGRLLLSMEHELHWLDWPAGTTTLRLELENSDTLTRLNDGRTDPAGRFIVGSMADGSPAGTAPGTLFRVEADDSVEALRTGIGITNGLAFDAARHRMYFADTPTQKVLVWDYDSATGERTNERVFLDYGPLDGKPDGACVDADGCYWSASVYGWAVIRVTPDGVVDRRIEVPVEKPSMPAFGGADLSTLYVTTIGDAGSKPSAPGRDGFTPGCLLSIDAGVQGIPDPLVAT